MSKKNHHATLLPNQVYHIYNHAVGTENLFKQPRNYAYFWQLWNKYITPYFSNYAFCLMPNHFHVLAKAKTIDEDIRTQIEKENTQKANAFLNNEVPPNVFYEGQFQRLFSTYSKAINKQEKNRYGSLFKAKFRRTLVSTLDDFIYFVQYIHHNPIRHGFTVDYPDWEYSSYTAYSEGTEIEGLATSPVFRVFKTETDDNGQQGFIDSHEDFKRNFKD